MTPTDTAALLYAVAVTLVCIGLHLHWSMTDAALRDRNLIY